MAGLPEVVGASDFARIIGSTSRWVQKLTAQGILTKDGRGRYPLAENVRAWSEWKVKSELEKISPPESAASRKDDAKARLLDIQIAEREHRLVDTEEAVAVLDEIVGTFRSELSGLPARVTRDLALRDSIEHEIDGALQRIADQLEARAKSLRTSGAAVSASEEVDA